MIFALNKMFIFCGGAEQKTPYPPYKMKKFRFSSLLIAPSFLLPKDKKIMAYNSFICELSGSKCAECCSLCELLV